MSTNDLSIQTMTQERAQAQAQVRVQKGKVLSISVAHLINDWYMNLVTTLLPFLIATGIGIGRSAFLVSAFTFTSSLLQPVFGYMVDRKNQRWMVYVGTAWMAIMLSLMGVIDNYAILFMLALMGGLGTAAFHPQASSMISSISGARKGFAQSVFSAAGNIGWALTPLTVIPIVEHWGMQSTIVFMVPGLAVAALLWYTAPRSPSGKAHESHPMLPLLRQSWKELTKVVAIVTFRSLCYFGMIAFLPLFLQTKGISVIHSGRFLFLMLFSGALGGLVGGYFSDKVGRKAVIVTSLLLTGPLFLLFLHTDGLAMYLFLALAGAGLLSSFSVTVVLAQEIISRNAAMAAGLTLGFGIGIGGLGVGAVGVMVERMGPYAAVNLLACFPFVAGLVALTLKKRQPSLN